MSVARNRTGRAAGRSGRPAEVPGEGRMKLRLHFGARERGVSTLRGASAARIKRYRPTGRGGWLSVTERAGAAPGLPGPEPATGRHPARFTIYLLHSLNNTCVTFGSVRYVII